MMAVVIARDVREGTIQKYLIQPIDQVTFLLMTRTDPSQKATLK